MLLENTRFEAGETKNDPELAKALASMAELYVSDAFGTVHRAHASTAGVAAYLPAVSGLLVAKELEVMGKALDDPKRPFVAVLGGAKVSDKIAVINNLLDKADTVIIGGGMAYTFAKAQGGEIGKSLLEEDKCAYALEMIEKAKHCRLSSKSCFGKCCFNKFSVADQILTTHSFKIKFMSTFFQQFIQKIFYR